MVFIPNQVLNQWYMLRKTDSALKSLKNNLDDLYGDNITSPSAAGGGGPDEAHERWYRAELLLAATRIIVHSVINAVIPKTWISVCSALETKYGSLSSAASFLPTVRTVFEDGKATSEQKEWYSEIKKHHSDQNRGLRHMKESNSDVSK
jgi:hypothetical protein